MRSRWYREVQQKVLEGASREIGVLRAKGLGWMVADAAVAAAHEQHAHCGDLPHDHRVVAGSARETPHLGVAGGAPNAVGPPLLHLGCTGYASDLQHLAPLNLDLPAGSDACGFRHDAGERRVA